LAVKSNDRSAHNKAAGKKMEVKKSMPTLQEFKAESPELYEMVMGQAKAAVEGGLQAKFDAEKAGLHGQIASLTAELKEKENANLKLEKENHIEKTKLQKECSEAQAETIWTGTLACCDVHESMHSKMRKMVKAEDYMKDGALDKASFQSAVAAEVADWEGRGMTASILGVGAGRVASGDAITPEAKAKAQEDADDEKWVGHMAALAGQTKGGDR
jgi:hypothetical protein